MKLNHIAIRVKDLERSIKFYKDIAELNILVEKEEFGARLAYMGDNNESSQIELICIPEAPTFEGKNLFICFACEDLEKKYNHAKKAGYNPSPIMEQEDGSDYFYIYDPDGVSVQLRKL